MNSGLLNDRISTQQHLGRNSNWLWRRKNPTSRGTNCFTGDIHMVLGLAMVAQLVEYPDFIWQQPSLCGLHEECVGKRLHEYGEIIM